MAKNPCGKTRKPNDPYEIWASSDGSWEWHVLKKWQIDDAKPYGRWFCKVYTPIVPTGEMGDVYVKDIKSVAHKIERSQSTYCDSDSFKSVSGGCRL